MKADMIDVEAEIACAIALGRMKRQFPSASEEMLDSAIPCHDDIEDATNALEAIRSAGYVIEAADTIERLREDRLQLLVMHYGRDPVGVAELCDTKLDRSGKLLGQVRDRAMIAATEGGE